MNKSLEHTSSLKKKETLVKRLSFIFYFIEQWDWWHYIKALWCRQTCSSYMCRLAITTVKIHLCEVWVKFWFFFKGPTALLSHKIGYGKNVTSYPSLKDKFTSTYQYKEDRVVHDGNLITSQGPGTTFEFALKIVEYLEGTEKMISVSDPMRVK